MLENAFRKAPFMRVLLPMAGGILLARQAAFPAPASWVAALVLLLLLLLWQVLSDRSPGPALPLSRPGSVWPGILLQGLFLCLGIILGREVDCDPVPETRIQARICEEVVSGARSCRTRLDRVCYFSGDHWVRLRGRVEVTFGRVDRCLGLRPGDCITARGELQAFRDPANPVEFDYAAYQRGRGVFYRLYLDSASWLQVEPFVGKGLKIRSELLRLGLVDRIDRNIEGPDERAILHALLLGYRSGLGEEVKQDFVRSGSMHILAVSGLHVGILYLVPAFLIGRLRGPLCGRLLAALLLLAMLWSYALLTGLSPSVVRAVSMCSIHRAAILAGRRTGIFHVLSLSAFLMVLARPAILFETGFQLSFTAVAGIAGFQKPLYRLLPVKGWLARRAWQLLTVSLSAQLATAPLSIYYFHQFSHVFWLTGLAVIPLATVILYVGLAFMILSAFGCYPVSGLLEWFTSLLGRVTRLAGGIPGGFTENLTLLPVQVHLLCLALLLACLFLRQRRVWMLQGVMLLAACLLLCSVIRAGRVATQEGFCVFALPRETAISFIRGREHALYRGGRISGDTLSIPYAIRNFCTRRKLAPPVYLDGHDPGGDGTSCILRHSLNKEGIRLMMVRFGEHRILMVNRWPAMSPDISPAFETDILVLLGTVPCNPGSLLTVCKPGQVIVDGSSYAWFHEAVEKACLEHGIPFHSTEKHGFYVLGDV